MSDLDAQIFGVVELPGIDARCVTHAASAQIIHRGKAITGAKLFALGKGRDSAVGFAIDESAMPRDALLDCLAGDLGARLQVKTKHGLTTVLGAHLERHEGCGSFWDANAPKRALSRVMAKWRTPIVLSALGIRWRSPIVGRARPSGVGVAHLRLHGEVDEGTAKKLLPAIKAASGRTIHLTIDSPGGSSLYGRNIYDALAAHPFRVEISIPREAHSIANVIAMAGNHRRMSPRAEMLVHESWLRAAHVNASNGPRMLQALERSAAQLAAIYATACNLPIATTREWMQKETYFSALDALKVGLIHEIATESGSPLLTAADIKKKSEHT